MAIDIVYAKRVAVGAAFKGAQALSARFRKDFNIRKKGFRDLVTDADIASEKAIVEAIRMRFPDHDVIAEEGGSSAGNSDYQWIIDPLDGTTNFAHGIAVFAVSIAFALHGEIVAGVVFNPETGELFTASRDEPAELNGMPVRVSSTSDVSDSLLATGFPYNMDQGLDRITQRLKRCLDASRGIRRLGSAAIDLCYVACGRFDGFWEENLKPWDTAAGMLIAKRAGAAVTDFSGNSFAPESRELLATNGLIHDEMLNLLKL